MQSDRAGIVLSEHDAIEAAFGRCAQREEVDVEIARAHREVAVENRPELRAQAFGPHAILRALRRIG